MTVRIDELICDVTVTVGAAPLPLLEVAPSVELSPEEETADQPPLEQALSSMMAAAEAGSPSGALAQQGTALPAGVDLPQNIDPRELAERVYRLMRQELTLARERE